MDISCPNCGEPWDVYHLRHDEPYEWDVLPFMRDQFIKDGSRFHGHDDVVRMAAEKAGWKFASDSVLSIVRCPACKRHEARGHIESGGSERQGLVAALAELLGDDDDGLASELDLMSRYL